MGWVRDGQGMIQYSLDTDIDSELPLALLMFPEEMVRYQWGALGGKCLLVPLHFGSCTD